MFGWLLVLFIVVPIAELFVIGQVWGAIGGWETIALLLAVSIAGAWLVRYQGVGILNRIQAQLAQGALPTNELVDGALVLFAGALMLTPGFITDTVGLLLLIPPSRAVVRRVLTARFRHRIDAARQEGTSAAYRSRVRFATFGAGPGFTTGGFTRYPDGSVIDLDEEDIVEDHFTDLPELDS